MLTSAAQQTALKRRAQWLRRLEVLFIIPLLTYGIGVLYEEIFCQSELSCDLYLVEGNVTLALTQLFYVIWPNLCLALIWLNFVLFDQDPRSDKLFGKALVVLGIGFVGIGLFFQTLLESGALGVAQYLYFALLLCFLTSAGLLLRRTYSWEYSSWFLKIRLSVLLLGYILTLIYPDAVLIGLFLSLAPLLLIPFDPRRTTLNLVPGEGV